MVGLDEGQEIGSLSLRELYAEDSWIELRDVAVPAVNHNGRWEGRSRLRHAQTLDLIDVYTKLFRLKAGEGLAAGLRRVRPPADRRETSLQEWLAEAQARKRAILESSLDPIITISHQGVITEFNRAAEQAFGHPREKVLGTKPSEVLFPPDDQRRANRTGSTVISTPARARCWASASKSPRSAPAARPSTPKWP